MEPERRSRSVGHAPADALFTDLALDKEPRLSGPHKKPRVTRGFLSVTPILSYRLELLIETVEQLVVLLIDPIINLVVAGATAVLLHHGLGRLHSR